MATEFWFLQIIDINILYTNSDSLLNKRDELQSILYEDRTDIVSITEVLPKNRCPSGYGSIEWNISGYIAYHPDFTNYKGRGCIIYAKDTLESFQVNIGDSQLIEHVAVGINCQNGEKLLIICVYRSPSATDRECIRELSHILTKRCADNISFNYVLITGDFNFKEIDWGSQTTSTGEEHIATHFLEIVRDSYLIQHVKEATRHRGTDRPSTLDLVFTNEEGMIDGIDHCAPLGNSDHEILKFKFLFGATPTNKKTEKLCYFKGNYNAINNFLDEEDWDTDLMHGSVEEAWDRFADKLSIVIKENVPVRKSSTRNFNTPWMDQDTLKAVKTKRKLWKRYKYCRNPQNKDLYDEAKQIASEKVRLAKRKYEKSIAVNSKEDTKLFWKFVQSKTKVKESIKCIKDSDGEVYSDNRKIAEELNNFFKSVFTKEDDANIPEFDLRTNEELTNVQFSEEIVSKLLEKVKESKSQGTDSIHPKFIKETAKYLAKPVNIIFRKSMEQGKLPDVWKQANVTPIHKKGPRHDVSNYRPISLTSILCKIMERIIRDAIMEHMEANRLFTKHQHGFRKGYSCVTQLIEVLDQWTEELDNHNCIDTIYLDFQKAFDTVPHQRLLNKLRGYGIKGPLLNWLENFLIGRKQRVVLNGEESEWTEVTSGIPQGSVLGPILFIIYINDLPDTVKSMVKLFADDTKIYSVVNNEEDQECLQSDINNLMAWSQKWMLTFNKKKCKYMHLGHEPGNTYKMEGEEITRSSEEKDLGINIDDKLKFQSHISIQVKKANQKLGLIRRSFTYMDTEMFLTLFKSLVRPHLEYGSNVWAVIYKKEAISLENVQRRATRLIPELRHLNYSDRLRKLGLPSLQYRRIRSDIVETYKIMNNIDKADKDTLFPQNISNTRGHKLKIYKRHCRTNIRKYSFSQRVVDLWNSLPPEVVEAKSVNSFKSKLNKHWKDFPLKFVPDCYRPEPATDRTSNETDRRGAA